MSARLPPFSSVASNHAAARWQPSGPHTQLSYCIFQHPTVWKGSRPIQNILLRANFTGKVEEEGTQKIQGQPRLREIVFTPKCFLSSCPFSPKGQDSSMTSHPVSRAVCCGLSEGGLDGPHSAQVFKTSFPVLWNCPRRTPTRCRSPLQQCGLESSVGKGTGRR